MSRDTCKRMTLGLCGMYSKRVRNAISTFKALVYDNVVTIFSDIDAILAGSSVCFYLSYGSIKFLKRISSSLTLS